MPIVLSLDIDFVVFLYKTNLIFEKNDLLHYTLISEDN